MINTIKDLKNLIQNLPDNMKIMGCKDSGNLSMITHWISSETRLTRKEISKF